MGRRMTGRVRLAPRLLRIPRVNMRYLNTNSTLKLTTTARATGGKRDLPVRLLRAVQRPKA